MQVEDKIQFKLFVGCVITPELRMQLNQSPLWKQVKIAPSIHAGLNETHYRQKNYIGLFLTQDKINLSELKQIETQITHALKSYCPQFASEKIRILVFSQVFIS